MTGTLLKVSRTLSTKVTASARNLSKPGKHVSCSQFPRHKHNISYQSTKTLVSYWRKNRIAFLCCMFDADACKVVHSLNHFSG